MKTLSFKSLRVIISLIVVTVIVVLTVVLVVTSYSLAYNGIEQSYMNQVSNFNKEIERNMVDFYEKEIANARFFAKSPIVINAAQTGKYAEVQPLIAHFFKERGIYEQVFISTAESNSLIVVSADGKANGVRWGDIPVYADNAKAALRGEVHVSDIGKSPVSGLAVILITAPIMTGNAVVGIMGLPVDVGQFSEKLVKEVKIGKTGYPFITNMAGLCVAHPVEKNIFTLDVNKYDWGQKMMAAESGSNIFYEWEGKEKFLSFTKNQKYRFIVATTMYISDINEQARSMAFIMMVIGLAAIVASAVFVYYFIARRLAPLGECKDIMTAMAQGNLTLRYNGVKRGDEIGEITKAMNDSMSQFEQVIAEIIAGSQNLGQAVQEIAGGNENLSQRTSEQASSLEEVASTIEEATASIKQNVDNAITANKKAVESSRMAEDGGRVVADAVNAINDVSQYSKKIGDIISVINEIAFQTNLLALNAAVEAARAGEQGRGFAVVAGEVRNLAQRAGSSAKEIGQLIKDSVDKVAVGTELANKSGEALKEIIQSVKSVGQMVAEISAASEEQKRGVDQINLAIAELDTMTQQNAALVEETASASEEMSNQSQELQVMMERFKIRDDVRGGVFSKKRKELHLHTEIAGSEHAKKDGGNGKKKISAATIQSGSKDIKDILTKEGFEEF